MKYEQDRSQGGWRRGMRGVTWVVLGVHLLAAVPAEVWASGETQAARVKAPAQTAATPPPPAAAAPVTVNRTKPRVSPPPMAPVFSAQPTDQEITRARVFAEPLLPSGRASMPQEDSDLAGVIKAYLGAKDAEAVLPFWGFLQKYPDSPWRASLLVNLGQAYRRTGYFTRALDTWEQAWLLAKDRTDPNGKAIGDRSVGNLLELHARLGRFDRLEPLLAEIKDRPIVGPATEQVTGAREGLWMMQNRPDQAFRCGPLAIDSILAATREGYARDERIFNSKSTQQGTSLAQMQQLASDLGLPMQMAHRAPGAPVIAPALVHWKAGHFAALIREEADRLLIRDPTFGNDVWISRAALDDEATGYVLVGLQNLPSAWRSVDAAEGLVVWGKGLTDGNDPDDNGDCDTQSGGGCGGLCLHMPRYNAHLMLVSLRIRDTPVGYAPPRGPGVFFSVTYSQREAFQPQTFYYSNLGPKWTFDWLASLEDDPTNQSANVRAHAGSGGHQTYAGLSATTTQSLPEAKSMAVLVRTGINPIRYERHLPNGAVEVYGQPDGAVVAPRRIFMTESRDAAGNTVSYTYDAQLRLVAATDALGQVTTLSYTDPASATRITRVTDPFGRFATFEYDTAGRLAAITDTLGLTSHFTYGADDFIASLTTPYGTSRFSRGENGRDRWLEMNDAVGGKERVEYRAVAGVPSSAPPNLVPAAAGVAFTNDFLQYRNTFYWEKRAMATAPRDLGSARVIHWLHAAGPLNQTSGTIESEQYPLERRVWYRYPGQTVSYVEGAIFQPSVVARVMDDGITQAAKTEYNTRGKITKRTDPLGRTTTYSYAANAIDLQEVRQTSGGASELLARYDDYNAQHLAETVIDTSGLTTSVTYSAEGQLLSATNPKNETTTYSYNSSGYLESIDGPLGAPAVQITPDAYGRPGSLVDANGETIVVTYDVGDRPTQLTYADGTYQQFVYDKLDLVRQRDRLGRWTRVIYDAFRRVVARRDPLGRTIEQRWCACGSLEALVDSKGQRTVWEYDARGRVTKELREGGVVATTYGYDVAGRLTTVTDAKAQLVTYAYNLDDTLHGVTYANAQIATAPVLYTYDSAFKRPTTMTDGVGLTTYTYKPTGTLGAGQIASVDGPFSSDTIVYEYDELGRVTGRTIGGVGTMQAYDGLGRAATESNALGTFAYTYAGSSGRLTGVTYPNGQTTTYTYDASGAQRLQTIHHKNGSSATLSKFDYTYDAIGNVKSWRQQEDAASTVEWHYSYDAADQLLTATKWNSATSSQLTRYAYRYDEVGNRTTQQHDDESVQSSYDGLNRLTSQQAGGDIRVAGLVNEPASVTINGKSAAVATDGTFYGTSSVGTGTTAVVVAATDASGNSQTRHYEVDTAGVARSVTYDQNGNMTSDGNQTYEWDAANRLVAVVHGNDRVEFAYNGVSDRVRATYRSGAVVSRDAEFIWYAQGLGEERDASTGQITRRLVRHGVEDHGDKYYYLRDHLSSVVAVTDLAGAIVSRYSYDPYGTLLAKTGAFEAPVGFGGHIAEPSIGLNLTRYRAYRPEFGRWLTPDPLLKSPSLAAAMSFAGELVYGYVGNNPVKFIDPDGLQGMVTTSGGIVIVLSCSPDPFTKVVLAALVVIGIAVTIYYICDRYQQQQQETCPASGGGGGQGNGGQGGSGGGGSGGGNSGGPGSGGGSGPRPYPGNDPTVQPAPDFEWRGPADKGSWYNPKTDEVLRPDLKHPEPIGPHWDYKDPDGKWHRHTPDGRVIPK